MTERDVALTPLLEVRDVTRSFSLTRTWFRGGGHLVAVDGVSLTVHANEVVALVGESGCGKTTLGRIIVRLLPPSGGQVLFDGVDLWSSSGPVLRPLRRHLQMIFQDPYSSLNPRKRIGDILSTPLVVNGVASTREARQRARDLLVEVGLPEDVVSRWPSQLSGGQQQRVGIARALALQPRLVVADEPVSALDVSVQAQIVTLLKQLQRQHAMSLIFISHDLALVRHIADRVAVMYLGRIVELAPRAELYARPSHPYTRALLSAVPRRHPDHQGRRILLSGEVGSGVRIPSGCRFHPRCWKAQEICRQVDPPLHAHAPGHMIACHFPETVSGAATEAAEAGMAPDLDPGHPAPGPITANGSGNPQQLMEVPGLHHERRKEWSS